MGEAGVENKAAATKYLSEQLCSLTFMRNLLHFGMKLNFRSLNYGLLRDKCHADENTEIIDCCFDALVRRQLGGFPR